MYSGAWRSFWTSLSMARNMTLKTDLASCFSISTDICTKLYKLYFTKLLNTVAVPQSTLLSKPLQNASPKCLRQCNTEFFRVLRY